MYLNFALREFNFKRQEWVSCEADKHIVDNELFVWAKFIASKEMNCHIVLLQLCYGVL